MTNTIESWLRSALGRRLEQVEGEFYVGCQPAADESPISIWVRFAGMARVRLSGKPDGWGMGLDETSPWVRHGACGPYRHPGYGQDEASLELPGVCPPGGRSVYIQEFSRTRGRKTELRPRGEGSHPELGG